MKRPALVGRNWFPYKLNEDLLKVVQGVAPLGHCLGDRTKEREDGGEKMCPISQGVRFLKCDKKICESGVIKIY